MIQQILWTICLNNFNNFLCNLWIWWWTWMLSLVIKVCQWWEDIHQTVQIVKWDIDKKQTVNLDKTNKTINLANKIINSHQCTWCHNKWCLRTKWFLIKCPNKEWCHNKGHQWECHQWECHQWVCHQWECHQWECLNKCQCNHNRWECLNKCPCKCLKINLRCHNNLNSNNLNFNLSNNNNHNLNKFHNNRSNLRVFKSLREIWIISFLYHNLNKGKFWEKCYSQKLIRSLLMKFKHQRSLEC